MRSAHKSVPYKTQKSDHVVGFFAGLAVRSLALRHVGGLNCGPRTAAMLPSLNELFDPRSKTGPTYSILLP